VSTAPPGYPTVPQHPSAPQHPELPDGITPTPQGPQWKAWMSFAALVAGFAAAVVGALLIAIGAAASGASIDDPPASVNILSLVVQDVCLVGAAIMFARMGGAAVGPADFGLRPTPFWRGVGWSVLTWLAFLVFTAIWVSVIGADQTDDELPKSLGVNDSDVALVSVALLVCVGAPIVEEFFFRGFFFGALQSWRGVMPAALITGAVFGLIHAGSSDPAFLLPLAFFGFALCLLRLRTRSLYPCIGTHALNNSLAFGASQSWDWQILPLLAGSLALIALVLYAVRARFGPKPALAG
jgi:membrane protease YdiL (CAAX protease family)